MNNKEKFEGENDLLNLLPKKVRESSELTNNAKLVLADIIFLCGTDYANEYGCCYRTNKDLMKDTNIGSHHTLSSCLTKLCGLGYITREVGVRGQASTYCINREMLETEKPTQSDDKNVTTGNDVTIDDVLDEIRILKDTVNSLYEYIRVNLGVKNDKTDVNLGVNSNKIGYSSNKITGNLGGNYGKITGNSDEITGKITGNLGGNYGKITGNSDEIAGKITGNLGGNYGKITGNCHINCPPDTEPEPEINILIATSDDSYTGNASVVKNETIVTLTTDERKKIFDWVKKTLDKGNELMSKYRDTHTREEADKLWSEITKLTSLMNKAIGKNKLTEKQCEMLQEFIAKASRANEAKEKYLSKVSEGNSVEYETTVTSTTEYSSYHPDGNGYCNGKFIECEFETKNGTSGKIEMTNKSVGEMLYKLHKLSGKEKSDYKLHVDELLKAYCPEKTTPRNGYNHLTAILAGEGEEAFFKCLKEMGVKIEEDVEADEIGTSPNDDNITSETIVTEPSKSKERVFGEDDFDYFTKGTEEKTSLRDNSRRLDLDNLPF